MFAGQVVSWFAHQDGYGQDVMRTRMCDFLSLDGSKLRRAAQAPKRKPAANPLPEIEGTAQAMQQFQVAAVSPGADDTGRQAKLNQYGKQQAGHYKFNSCLRT